VVKPSLLTVILLAVASSLVTVGAIELLRGSRSSPEPVEAVEPRAKPTAVPASQQADLLVPASTVPSEPAAYEERLAELERRILALEQSRASRRAPVPSAADTMARDDDLRELVLDWVAEERETRRRAAELEEVEERRKELEFGTRMNAHVLALEHGLAEWEEDKLAAVLLEIETRRDEVEGLVNPLTDDPKEAERRFIEFDEWADRRLKEELGQELIERLFGEV